MLFIYALIWIVFMCFSFWYAHNIHMKFHKWHEDIIKEQEKNQIKKDLTSSALNELLVIASNKYRYNNQYHICFKDKTDMALCGQTDNFGKSTYTNVSIWINAFKTKGTFYEGDFCEECNEFLVKEVIPRIEAEIDTKLESKGEENATPSND